MWPFKKKRPPGHVPFYEEPESSIPPELLTLMTQDVGNWVVERDTDEKYKGHFNLIHVTGIVVCTSGHYALKKDLWIKDGDMREPAWQLHRDIIALKSREYIAKHLAGGGPCPRP